MIGILIADDHEIVRHGLKALISTCPGMEVVGEAATGAETVKQAGILQPDVIILDMVMPDKNGVEAILEIKESNPEAHILVLTSFVDDQQILTAIKSGALGYILKDSSPHELIRSIRAVHNGDAAFHPAVARILVDEFRNPSTAELDENPLTRRELEVLKLVAQGLTNQQIAELLRVSESTIGKHIGNILDKLELPNRTQAALYALRLGIVKLNSG